MALLRAVNVGGRTVPMADLRALAEGLGLDDVSTYIASGNLLFRSAHRSPAAVRTLLEPALQERFGFAVETAVRSAARLREVVEGLPFDTTDQVSVSYLLEPMTADGEAALHEHLVNEAVAVVRGDHVYLRTPNGLGQPFLARGHDKRFAATGTSRNWRTAAALADLAAGRHRAGPGGAR
ncbi:hypothetical protein GCM10025868_43060 [Angustibacter aerolatus]|uniref:DUF1697 domain-containing protein n=1 Tax=Angustibacter aerolatus TaxID=1162965 RepID=A0ABQ6JNC6_9ACTN|nr:hypothetical protein GCM10025868_43060 [Angustibacter aerolatus]